MIAPRLLTEAEFKATFSDRMIDIYGREEVATIPPTEGMTTCSTRAIDRIPTWLSWLLRAPMKYTGTMFICLEGEHGLHSGT